MASISRESIEKILDAADIVDVVGSYFPLKRAGVNFVAICPFHNEKSPSFNVSPQRQIFHCFGCQESGDSISFVQKYEGLPFAEAARKLADKLGVIIEEEAFDPEAEAKRRSRAQVLKLQGVAADWFHHQLFKKSWAQPARDYLKSRGIGMETARNWKFGYAPDDSRHFFEFAKAEGFTQEQLVSGGLAKWSDENNPRRGAYAFFRHRLMFPVNNEFGEPIAFSGRVLSPDQRGGKYVNSPETAIFSKSKTFFGFDRSKRAIMKEGRVVVCEGQLDMVASFEAGIEHIVAPLGTAFTEEHGRLLKRYTEEVVLCFDSDTAGINAATKAFRVLAPVGMLVRLAMLPSGEDPDSLIRKQGPDALRDILASAPEFFDYQIDRRGSALTDGSLRDRLQFARDLAAEVALVKDKMLQDSLVSRITVRLGVGEDDIRKQVRNAAATREKAEKGRQVREEREKAGLSTGRRPTVPAASEDETPKGVAVEINNRSIRLLCQALLTDAETRAAIISSPLPDWFRSLPETELLTELWRANFDPSAPASLNAYLAMCPAPERACLIRILAEPSPQFTPELARECLVALHRQSRQREIAALKARLGDRKLPPLEAERISKQLLDLRNQVNERP
jgi:DNA primase